MNEQRDWGLGRVTERGRQPELRFRKAGNRKAERQSATRRQPKACSAWIAELHSAAVALAHGTRPALRQAPQPPVPSPAFVQPLTLLELHEQQQHVGAEQQQKQRRGERVKPFAAHAHGDAGDQQKAHAEQRIDIEGLPTSERVEPTPRMLLAPDLERARRLELALDSSEASPAETLAEGSALARSLGVPLPALSAEQFADPTPLDLAIAGAMVQQFALLSTEATATSLADAVGRSPRQLQRIIQDFNRRYGLNAGNWRDTRNRWRLQTAVLLLSVPSLSIAEIAAKVGYRSPNALARAFAKVGFPAPAELRQELLTPAESVD